MNTKLTNILLIIILIFNVVFLASWWHGRSKMHHMRRDEPEPQNTTNILNDKSKGEGFLVKTLGLDTNQRMKLDNIMEAHYGFLDKYMNAYTRIQSNLFNIIKTNKDTISAYRYADSLGALKTAMERELFDNFNNIKGICKPEQLSKFNELIDNMNKEFVHRHDLRNNARTKQDSL